MELIRGLHNLGARGPGCVLSVGNYDGVHRGHQSLLAELRRQAQALGLPATVMTFEPTPREYFAPQQAPRRVLTLRDKLDRLAAHGVDRVLLLRFDARLARQSAEAFIHDTLVATLGMRVLVIGDDFRFGAGRRGDYALLAAEAGRGGYRVMQAPVVQVDAARCSSTALRAALAEARLDHARQLLGTPYAMTGRVRHGKKLARTLDMPTANLPLKRLPPLPYGVYAVRLSAPGRFERLPGVASLGVRPTIGTTPCLLEAHAFGEVGDLYGQTLRVEFLRFERPELRFDSLDALKAQMRRDADGVQALFAAGGDDVCSAS
jgi:riboflavin kinase / FMN adenylyltransferase